MRYAEFWLTELSHLTKYSNPNLTIPDGLDRSLSTNVEREGTEDTLALRMDNVYIQTI